MASNTRLLLQELHKKPNVRGDEPSVVITFKRSLPASATSRPSADALRGAVARPRPSSSSSQAIGTAKAAFTDMRHVANIDRESILAKLKGFRIVPELPLGVASTERLDFRINVEDEFRDRALEFAPEPEIPAEGVEAPQAVKLSQRAILDTSTKSPRKGATAAAAADALEAAEAEAEPFNMQLEKEGAAVPTQKLVVRQRKPKVPKEPVISVSAAAAVATEEVTKIAKKAKDDAKQDDKFALSTAIKIGDEIVSERLPRTRALPQIQASDFYMNNRAKFIQYINDHSNRTHENDFIDMVLLSKGNHMVLSTISTYSEAAWYLGGCNENIHLY